MIIAFYRYLGGLEERLAKVEQTLIGGLEERLAKVEQKLIRSDGENDGTFASSQQRDYHVGQYRRARSEEDENGLLLRRSDGFIATNDEDGAGPVSEESTDGMGAIVFTDEEDSAFFGEFK
jgi:hypothetical protein